MSNKRLNAQKSAFVLAKGTAMVNVLPTQTCHPEFISGSQNLANSTMDRSRNKFGMTGCKNKVAFTLAEVLITLGIIGVVSALTIPQLVTKYQKQRTVTKLKKTYSMLQQISKMSQDDNGPFAEGYSLVSSIDEYVEKYFMPYMQIIGKKYKNRNKIKTLSQYFGNGSSFLFDLNWYYLKDGTCFAFYIYPNDKNYFLFFDINGDSQPNAIGRDIFVFDLYNFDNIDFYTALRDKHYKGEALIANLYSKNDSNYVCNPERVNYFSGYTCGAIIKLEGWKIKNNYPWK